MRIIGPAVGASLIGFVGSISGQKRSVSRNREPQSTSPAARSAGSASARLDHLKCACGDRRRASCGLAHPDAVVSQRSVCGHLLAQQPRLRDLSMSKRHDLGNRAETEYGMVACQSLGRCGSRALAREYRGTQNWTTDSGYLGPLVIPVLITPPVPALLLCWFLFGLADAFAVIAMQAYLAESVEASMRGRVYATWHGRSRFLAHLLWHGWMGHRSDRSVSDDGDRGNLRWYWWSAGPGCDRRVRMCDNCARRW